MIKRNNIRGETLAETIIALSILAIGIAIASTIMINSFRNLSNAKSRVVAVNIAREAIEAMRSIRDTNWLLYSSQRRQCWNHDPSQGLCDVSNPTPILPGTYIIYKHIDDSWHLALADNTPGVDTDGDGDQENDLDLVSLALVDIDPDIDSDNADEDDDDGTGNEDDFDMYNHEHPAIEANTFGTESRTTAFSRYIIVEYMENVPGIDSLPDDPADAINTENEWNNALDTTAFNRMRVTAVVTWLRGSAEHSAELTTIITDHLGRESLNN